MCREVLYGTDMLLQWSATAQGGPAFWPEQDPGEAVSSPSGCEPQGWLIPAVAAVLWAAAPGLVAVVTVPVAVSVAAPVPVLGKAPLPVLLGRVLHCDLAAVQVTACAHPQESTQHRWLSRRV